MTNKENKNRIMYTALGGRIMIGDLLADGTISNNAIERKEDFLECMLQFMLDNKSVKLDTNTNKKYLIEIKEVL